MDDQGYQDVGMFGSKTIKTPHLDRMAGEGMKFTDFTHLRGLLAVARGLDDRLLPAARGHHRGAPRTLGLNPEETTVAEILKTRGYATAAVGKWHIGHLPKFRRPTMGSTAISESPTPTTWMA